MPEASPEQGALPGRAVWGAVGRNGVGVSAPLPGTAGRRRRLCPGRIRRRLAHHARRRARLARAALVRRRPVSEQATTARELLVMAEGAISGTRREGERELPLGERARRTRNALLRGAWDSFCEKGYRATQPADIAGRAGASVGTFYQYFRSRADVMSVLVAILVRGQVSDRERSMRIDAGPDTLHRAIDGYLRGYEATAAFQGAWDEAAHTDPDLA